MDALNAPDLHHLRAALGWLELGNSHESLLELDRLSDECRQHPDVLEVRWAVLADQQRWDEAAKVARALIGLAPERPSAWLHHAYALRRATGGGVLAAFNALSPVAGQFPKEALIPYNLACYTCQLQRDTEEILSWLRRAMSIGNRAEILAQALADPDLAAIRPEIEQLGGDRPAKA